ncbi:hypothetical protein KC19_3G078700 [Ceratodon purpureus]|uniref:Uncharacterized protein n=1 Tax=Ceratodon purpureus TaxID=3225 RepID=A0A8T0II71_CERPU|nr:hypothetical protein KC19_3G078700 [Ceratodon purpureus]
MRAQRPKKSTAARSSKNRSKTIPSSIGKSCKLLKPCKPKKRVRTGVKLCEHKPVKRYKLIKSCELKKQMNMCNKPGRPPKTPNLKLKGSRSMTKPLKNHKELKRLKTHKFRQRKAYKKPLRIKFQTQKLGRRPKMSMMDVDDPEECPSSDSSSLNLSDPVIVPRKTSNKRPMGFRALLCRLFGLGTKRRPRPQPFQF